MTDLFYLEKCSSTQDEIEHFLSVDNRHLKAVYTFNQTKGKGQYGNSWESGENKNIAYSLAIPTELLKTQNHLLNFRTAELVADFLANLTKGTVEIKWPNDLIIINKKVSGLLIERKMVNSRSYYIIGIGINVLQEYSDQLPKAGSILTQTGVSLQPESLVNELHRHLKLQLLKKISDVLIIENVNKHLFRKDIISVFQIGQIRQNGIIRAVDENGYLSVELEHEGLQKFFNKEITLLY